jgi:mannan endo-1,6-alpha-mannosidase
VDRTLAKFFPEGVAIEPQCENKDINVCNEDEVTFKGYVHRWLASTTQVAPFTKEKIMKALKTSAQAAVDQCTGGDNGRMCGFNWVSRTFDGRINAGEQMNVLGALTSLLVEGAAPPVTNSTGGTSEGNANAGSETPDQTNFAPITAGDKAGAGILTALLLAGGVSVFAWMNMDP